MVETKRFADKQIAMYATLGPAGHLLAKIACDTVDHTLDIERTCRPSS